MAVRPTFDPASIDLRYKVINCFVPYFEFNLGHF